MFVCLFVSRFDFLKCEYVDRDSFRHCGITVASAVLSPSLSEMEGVREREKEKERTIE